MPLLNRKILDHGAKSDPGNLQTVHFAWHLVVRSEDVCHVHHQSQKSMAKPICVAPRQELLFRPGQAQDGARFRRSGRSIASGFAHDIQPSLVTASIQNK
jgi:hypothetical protein